MNNRICPDCKSFDVASIGNKKYRCDICNWQGYPLHKDDLSTFELKTYAKEQKVMKEERQKGKLFFILIYVKDIESLDENDQWVNMMQWLGLKHLDDPQHDPPYYFIKVTKKPPEHTIVKIKALPGVIKVMVE